MVGVAQDFLKQFPERCTLFGIPGEPHWELGTDCPTKEEAKVNFWLRIPDCQTGHTTNRNGRV